VVNQGKPSRFGGVVVPMVTPFTPEGTIDEVATRRMVDRLLSAGVRSFLLLGTTGEAASISASEKLRFVNCALQRINGQAHVYVGLANNSLEDTFTAAHAYAALGVDAVVGHLPNYYPLSSGQMHEWFELLADTVRVPLFLYNIPMTTKMSIPIDIVQRLAEHPNVFGMKDSEYDVERLEKLIAFRTQRDDFTFFVGPSVMSMRGLQLGADGFVPGVGNVVPEACLKLMRAAQSNDWAAAEAAQDAMKRVGDTYMPGRSVGDAIAILKAVLAELGLCDATVLPPLTPPDGPDRLIIKATVQALAATAASARPG
jgi:dihydrodipicolinate synthase/N-acetylneuraminate lyase